MAQILGVLDKVIFEGEDGFFIGVLKDKTKISGKYYESDINNLVGSAISLNGFLDEHKKYGNTFKFESLKVNQNPLFFFLNKVIKGFTKKLTSELIEKYGEEGLIDILDNDIQKLKEHSGIKEKRLAKIQESWKDYKSMRQLGEFLAPLDVTPTLITTIATALKDLKDPVDRIQSNPYILTSINGIGFKRADEIALRLGIKTDSPKRITSAMDSALREYCDANGNSCVKKEILYQELTNLMGHISNEVFEDILEQRVIDDEIKKLDQNIYSPKRLYEAERYIYDEIRRRSKDEAIPLVSKIDKFIDENDLKLGDEQKKAVELINTGHKIILLIGYAGTGKSTTSKVILNLLATKYTYDDFITIALSGIASQRIGETTGYKSSTIQSLLMKSEDKDYFSQKVVLIDEASMINSTLFARVLSKIHKDATLVIVGDDAQLPPIGSGNVLSDLIELKLAPIAKLTKIYRQSDKAAITLIANDIRNSKVPYYKDEYDDFKFIDVSLDNYYAQKSSLNPDQFKELKDKNNEEILANIADIAIDNIDEAREFLKNKNIKSYINFFQVITPMKNGTLGVDNLNNVLQKYFNPKPKKCVKKGGKDYSIMDKVVHIKNENMPTYTDEGFKNGDDSFLERIFNGMSGLLFAINEEDELAHVYYPNEMRVVEYEFSQLKTHLTLSYALTIHKVQGMEYSRVVMPITYSHFIMHNTKLLYTAITRAKDELYLVGEAIAFESACKRVEVTQRDTVLKRLMN